MGDHMYGAQTYTYSLTDNCDVKNINYYHLKLWVLQYFHYYFNDKESLLEI